MNFSVLPPEVISTILYSVGARSIIRCRQICRSLKNIIDGSVRLQYLVELEMTGNVDGPREYTTIAEKLAHLKRFDRSWRRLEWTTQVNWTIPGGTLLWELYGGILITGQSEEEGWWKIDIRELPSSRKEPPVRAWGFDRIALPLVDLATHTKHDLLVLVSKQDGQSHVDVHLRTLSRNESHPLAKLGVLRHEMMTTNNTHGFLVHIAGSLLGMLASHIDDLGQVNNQLVIWDWTTGNRLAFMNCLRGFIDFAFLSQRYFLLSCLDMGNTAEHVPSPSLDVYDLRTSAGYSPSEYGYHVRRYLLPSVKASAMASLIRIYAESSAESEPPVCSGGDLDVGQDWLKYSSFSVSPMSTLYAIQIFLKPKEPPMGGDVQELILFAPHSTFLPSSASPRPDISPLSLEFEFFSKIRPATRYTRAKTVAWDKWGPHGTRLMRHSDFFNLEHSYYPFGSRIVLPSSIPPRTDSSGLIVEEYEECRIKVLEFNPIAVQRFFCSDHHKTRISTATSTGTSITPSKSEIRLHVEPYRISSTRHQPSYLERAVTTYLPYIETICTQHDTAASRTDGDGEGVNEHGQTDQIDNEPLPNGAFDADSFMLTEDAVIVVRAGEFDYDVKILTF